MNIFKEILANEVFPALGCTEPISCAYATALAADILPEPPVHISLRVDPGTFKNGAAVTVPNSGNRRGNLIAAMMGALIADPSEKLQILSLADDEIRGKAYQMICDKQFDYDCITGEEDFRIEAIVKGNSHSARCVLACGHTCIESLELDGQAIKTEATDSENSGASQEYRQALKDMGLEQALRMVESLDQHDLDEIRKGVEMNLAMVERGYDVKLTAYQLRDMKQNGFLTEDVFYRAKERVASAVDARMSGLNQPVMTSGGSGNQGIVAILTPYTVGRELNLDTDEILKSIAVSHIVNAYIKCFVGELAVICGCAMAAGIAAAVAIVYQAAGLDMQKISLAVGNVIGDLSGLICDGAKPGCSLKTISSVDSAIRSALMALKNHGLGDEGVVGADAEMSIRNLSRITVEGMLDVDQTVVDILRSKAQNPKA